MRRTARALSVAFAAGAVLAVTGPVARAVPGGPTATASCDPVTALVPDTPDGTSPAGTPCSEGGLEGAVPDGGGGGPLGAAPDGAGADGAGPAVVGPDGAGRLGAVRDGVGEPGSGEPAAGRESAGPVGPGQDGSGRDGTGQVGAGRESAGPDGVGPDGVGPDGAGRESAGPGAGGRDSTGREDSGQVGAGRDGGAQDGSGWGNTGRDEGARDDHACQDPRGADCPDGHGSAAVQRGVDAGQGGTFNDSVPALAAGAACLAAACAGAVYRVHGRRRFLSGEPPGV
ncbi:hypothetical protein KBP30_08330 [Streptomyces sp. Go40/10]|uniref:hypothetical protein n=1 Tax=Streptomyces sp. Go40/10 TaxID=2825844 RepID=UPI001E521ECD|nr:hypothetical protein [Streptomyces sp. Go40/10]UFR01182.1 hypothetical protein KBP30_08330 [Streptomyces sp. Go40/10]